MNIARSADYDVQTGTAIYAATKTKRLDPGHGRFAAYSGHLVVKNISDHLRAEVGF